MTGCDSRMYRPTDNSKDKQIWDSKADEKLAPISSRQPEVLELCLSLGAFSFFEMDIVWLFFQARIRPLIVYLQNAVQFNKARKIHTGQ